jgi:4-amino-4-deoxy-L-arabinose transferase-like glycosyltransferase
MTAPAAAYVGCGARAHPVVMFLTLLIPLTLLHGLLYAVLVPPWQHYDEPTHFEYARLIALWGRQPAIGEFDLDTRREIADSMYRFRFWEPGMQPTMFASQPPNIGVDEKIHPPLYYTLVALPVRILRFAAVEQQLYGARLIGVALYVLVVICAWRIGTILAPDLLAAQLALPLVVLLVPAFTDQMTSVNNDTLVNFSMAALLLGCVLLIRDGPGPLPLGLAALSLAVGILTKRTAVVGVAPAALALFWALRRRPLHWWVVALLLAALAVLGGLAAFQYDESGLSARPWLVDLNQRYLRLSLERTSQLAANSTLLQHDARLFDVLFTSFWARLGWGHVSLGDAWDWVMRLVTLVGVIGLVFAGARRAADEEIWRRRVVLLMIVTVLVAWLAAVLRFDPQQSEYLPRGRYIHLAIVPTIWLLVRGFEGLASARWRPYAIGVLVLIFVAADITAWAGALSAIYYR